MPVCGFPVACNTQHRLAVELLQYIGVALFHPVTLGLAEMDFGTGHAEKFTAVKAAERGHEVNRGFAMTGDFRQCPELVELPLHPCCFLRVNLFRLLYVIAIGHNFLSI